MQRGMDDSRARGSLWEPTGNVPFQEFVREVHSWLNVTSGAMTLPQQAAALQRGLGGLARILAMRVPSQIINYGVMLQGQRTDAATYIIFLPSTKFENLEDERQLSLGTALIDFRVDRESVSIRY